MKPRMRSLQLFGLILAISLTGCYVATVDTGRTPSTKVIRVPWASSWIYGLVPPKTVMTATECADGVAKVETQHTFLNQVVGMITFGIYTPMQITVTCAEASRSALDSGTEIYLAKDASPEAIRDAFGRAAEEAVRTQGPVFVHMN